ncbi:MAG: hypothetical protein HN353_12955 [Bdellovibrionales bacterium]|nr:hypothetical protein [Bdellovibrionales bacterium]MBT3525946.1 hypothetical protein [Bdellovibrionales bacterium]MBT7668806.1 hypothetical protein [Bdellovibrionales bacterium]MBT7767083.1 hypothetical protein [Bdellovibrionales bacterium]
MTKRSLYTLLILLLTSLTLQSCFKDDEDAQAPADTPVDAPLTLSSLVVSFTCSNATDCADNSADDGNGASASFSIGSDIYAWAYGIAVTCSGGSCTGATNSGTVWRSYINGSLNIVTELAAGNYAFTLGIDSNGDNTYAGNGEPQEYYAVQPVTVNTTSITIFSGFLDSTALMAEKNEERSLILRDAYLID